MGGAREEEDMDQAWEPGLRNPHTSKVLTVGLDQNIRKVSCRNWFFQPKQHGETPTIQINTKTSRVWCPRLWSSARARPSYSEG